MRLLLQRTTGQMPAVSPITHSPQAPQRRGKVEGIADDLRHVRRQLGGLKDHGDVTLLRYPARAGGRERLDRNAAAKVTVEVAA